MKISEIKDTARKTLSGKLVNVYIIASFYTLINFALQFILKQITSKTGDFVTLIFGLFFSIIQFCFSYGFISNLIQISKQRDPLPYTQFITDAVLNASKVLKLMFSLILKLLIPLTIFSLACSYTFFYMQKIVEDMNYKIPLLIASITFLISIIWVFCYGLNFVLSLFCLVDNGDKPSKEHVSKSKTLMKGNKLKYLNLIFSFIGYYILIILILNIAKYFLDKNLIQIISTILTMLLTPYITISQYIFYEELLPVETDKE